MVISDEILESVHVSEAEVRAEVALALFSQDRLTLSQAARLANLPQLDFQALRRAAFRFTMTWRNWKKI